MTEAGTGPLRQKSKNARSYNEVLCLVERIERRPDVLESVLWDAEGQKLSDPALVGFVVSEIKSRIPA